MNLIVAADEKFAIGKGGTMPWHISADLKYFKQMTTGKTVIMGRKTLESFPGGKPLPNRTNIVISRNKDFKKDGTIVVNSVEEAFKLAGEESFVIGGGEIYKMFLKYVKFAYVTKIYNTFEADTYMVDLDNEPGWKHIKKGELMHENGIDFSFDVYENTNI